MTTAETAPSLDLGFWEWVAYGQVRGWCSDVICETHDGLPMSDNEVDEWEQGYDPCIHAIRVYGD